MVKQLRAVTAYDAHERHDLAGFTALQAAELVSLGFGPSSAPYPLPLRFTFIVGGGRLVRAKYDEALLKWLTAALREAGFDDDRGAAIGSSKVYKRQEDTDQNLVYLHVFPVSKVVEKASEGDVVASASAQTPSGPTPTARVIAAPLPDFQKLVANRVMTWNEKRSCAAILAGALAKLDDFELRLSSRAALTPVELSEYQELSREGLTEKVQWLHGEIKGQVASKRLSAREFSIILGEMDVKMAALKGEVAGGRAAAATALEQLTAKAVALKTASAAPVHPPFRGEAEIRKCRAALGALDRLEAKCAGRLLSVAEARDLSSRVGLIDTHNALIDDARGFFEETIDFELRLASALAAGAPPGKKR